MPNSQVTVRAVLFDLDDTLIDRLDALTRLNRYWYRTLPRDHRPESENEFVTRLFRAADRFSSPRDLYDWMLGIWPGSFRDADTALSAHNAILPNMVRLASRTRGMLNYLKGARVPVGVVTNGGTLMQWAKVRNAGVDRLVDAVVVSEDFGAHKPHPSIFEHALRLIRADASETMFIGDDQVADIGGATGVGMQTAWMCHGRTWDIDAHRPDHIINSVWEVEGLISI